MTTICGHERETLQWAIKLWANIDNTGQLPFTMGGKVSPDDARNSAFRDANDPAKLAEMLVHEGRRLGLDVGAFDAFGGAEIQIWPRPRDKTICIDGNKDSSRLRVMTMQQTRATLLQWLQLPAGAREEAERALRSNQ